MLPIKTHSINLKKDNRSIAQETLGILKAKVYEFAPGVSVDFSKAMENSIKGTKYYPDPISIKCNESVIPTLEVINETTTQAAVRLSNKDNLVALNFASATTPGGGWLHGAKAQEEDLARMSGLYASIRTKPEFYNTNILCESMYYTDGIIYSPKVPFFRDDYSFLLEKPYYLSIITAPAPNLFYDKMDIIEVKTILERRALKIIQVAADNGHKNIILGAWGCGIFGNDPGMVSKAFVKALAKVPVFEHVCFPVYDTRDGQPLYKAFKKIIKEVNGN